MIIALIGKDEFTKDKRIEKFLQDTLGDRKDDPMARQILFATDPNIDSIAESVITACDSVSMFSPEQTVVVRKADAGEIEKYEEPPSYKMADWIAAAIPTHFNKAIDRDACIYLADALGTQTKMVCEEIEKVLMFQPDCKRLTLDLVKSMVVPQRKIISYEINTPFGMRDAKAYARMLNEMFRSGVDAVPIVSSLYSYAIDLLNLQALLDKKMSPKDAAAALGKNDFIFNIKGKAPECAKRWGKPLLCRVIRRLADLDYEIKSGKCSTKIAQELALAALVVR